MTSSSLCRRGVSEHLLALGGVKVGYCHLNSPLLHLEEQIHPLNLQIRWKSSGKTRDIYLGR